METNQKLDKQEKRKRRRELITVGLVLLVIAFSVNTAYTLSKVSTTLPFVNSIFFFGIINLNLILLAVLVFLIFRNLSKVFLERKKGIGGSKLKTKLVLAFFTLSAVPTIVLFTVSAFYINSTFDKWFSVRVHNTLQASLEITNSYYKNSQERAHHFAEKIREDLWQKYSMIVPSPDADFLDDLNFEKLKYSLDAIEFYSHPLNPRTLVLKEELSDDFFPHLPMESVQAALRGESASLLQHVGSGDVLRSIIPIYESSRQKKVVGVLAVSYHIPVSIVGKVAEISSTFADYSAVNPLKYPIKTIYFSILILITLLILFVATWVGIYLARQLMDPLDRLEVAAKEIGSGNLDLKLNVVGNDEFSTVMKSFNKMTSDIRDSRNRLESTNEELEEKRRYVEAILSNVSAGVFSISSDSELVTINKSAAVLMGKKVEDVIGMKIADLFSGDLAEIGKNIDDVIKNNEQQTIFKNSTLSLEDKPPVSLVISITPLFDSDQKYQGLVIVLDDITHVMKAQREAAWREVARRIAHEIKNPLTPIKLSAQRLQKRLLNRLNPEDSAIFEECTSTIVQQVDDLKQMVNEFSQFARIPTVNPVENDLNSAISEITGLYGQAHKGLDFDFAVDKNLPTFAFDREQIKRVVINLLDNAVAAISDGQGKIIITTNFKKAKELVVVEIRDNGPGIPDSIMPLLFEPYFSTKNEGTGLGLAIAKRIINDHNGYIRVSAPKDGGRGTCFTIELPINRSGEVVHAP